MYLDFITNTLHNLNTLRVVINVQNQRESMDLYKIMINKN